MIVELTASNFKSIREPTTISFLAGKSKKLPGNLLLAPNRERFLKSMALYGPNASGKTTVLDALYALRFFVLFSSQDQKPTAKIPQFEPFALDRGSLEQPTQIALTIQLERTRYTLDVAATPRQVWKESLTMRRVGTQPSRKVAEEPLIERVWDANSKRYTTTLSEELGPELTRRAAVEQTTRNRLTLGKLASLNSELARKLVEWFENAIDFYDMHRNPLSEDSALADSARLLKEDQEFAGLVTRFLKDADTGIQELSVVDEKVLQPVFSEQDEMEVREVSRPALSFRHATGDGSEVFFRRQKESSGTLRFVAMLVALLKPGPRRRLICIDELSASMHPDLVCRLLRLVHSSHFNVRGNQLLFTTHDTHLIDPSELLRRDQVTICTKDRHGRTTTRRLDEFEDLSRSDANLQKQYLQGRFGGLPQFGPKLEDVPLDDEPLEVGRE